MLVVRYTALVALVVWLGVMQNALFGDRSRHPAAAFACGGILIVALFVMKFLGPPPRGFIPRAAIAFVMLVVTALDYLYRGSTVLVFVNAGLGLVLLSWYAHE